jgi:hypothetical protein
MKRILLSICFAVVIVVAAGPAHSFNPAAHIYIAERVLPGYADRIDLSYGSIAPDLSQYTDPGKWQALPFDLTHYDYIDIRPYAGGTSQKAFAAGWFTHNEVNGADHYAHGTRDLGYADGYVTIQAMALTGLVPGLTPDLAHFAVETAIDLLLKEKDRSIGSKLLKANLLRSPLDRELLTKVLVLQHRETDWLTLVAAELTFRNVVNQYASALALPKPFDKEAIIRLGVQLALQQYGITATEDELRALLEAAISLCLATHYYEAAVLPAIQGITLP